MKKLFWRHMISAFVLTFVLSGCASTQSSTPAGPGPSRSFKEYLDHGFNPQEYVEGMIKGGHNLLIWRNPTTDLSKYKAINLTDFGERLLPAQDRFSYAPFVKSFNLSLQPSLKSARDKSGIFDRAQDLRLTDYGSSLRLVPYHFHRFFFLMSILQGKYRVTRSKKECIG